MNGWKGSVVVKNRSYCDLDEQEQQRVSEFLARFPGAQTSFRQAVGEPAFEHGRNLVTLWADGAVAGTIGVVTREASVRSEIFIALVYVEAQQVEQVLPRLLQEAYRVGRSVAGAPRGTSVRLGIRPGLDYLRPELERAGFQHPYRILELVRPVTGPEEPETQLDGLSFVPVTPANLDDYINVHNAAFLRSPNGASTDAEDVRGQLREAASPDLYQVGYVGGSPAVALGMAVDGMAGELEILAIAPRFQGQGLGRVGLHRALRTLAALGVEEVRLLVVETNTRALHLYLRTGFERERTFATWFVGPPLFLPGPPAPHGPSDLP